MPPVDWKDFRKICLKLGCEDARRRGSHLVMTRPGMARPVVIPTNGDLRPDVISSNLRTLGISREKFEEMLSEL